MKPLPKLSVEMKALTTATLLFAGLALLVALAYVDVSHRGLESGYLIGPANIAATYYGPGVSVETLISLAHIHMLGLLPIFWIIGFIFIHSSVARGWKMFWSLLPFAAFFFDISGWFLTKTNPDFVYFTIVGGGLFILALAVMIFLSLYDMWIESAEKAPVVHAGTAGSFDMWLTPSEEALEPHAGMDGPYDVWIAPAERSRRSADEVDRSSTGEAGLAASTNEKDTAA